MAKSLEQEYKKVFPVKVEGGEPSVKFVGKRKPKPVTTTVKGGAPVKDGKTKVVSPTSLDDRLRSRTVEREADVRKIVWEAVKALRLRDYGADEAIASKARIAVSTVSASLVEHVEHGIAADWIDQIARTMVEAVYLKHQIREDRAALETAHIQADEKAEESRTRFRVETEKMKVAMEETRTAEIQAAQVEHKWDGFYVKLQTLVRDSAWLGGLLGDLPAKVEVRSMEFTTDDDGAITTSYGKASEPTPFAPAETPQVGSDEPNALDYTPLAGVPHSGRPRR